MYQAEALPLHLQADLRQERAKVRLVLWGGDVTGPEERLLSSRFFLGVFVGTATVIAIETHPIVVVAHDGRDAALADETDCLVRHCAIADEISQVIDRIRHLSIDRRQDR